MFTFISNENDIEKVLKKEKSGMPYGRHSKIKLYEKLVPR